MSFAYGYVEDYYGYGPYLMYYSSTYGSFSAWGTATFDGSDLTYEYGYIDWDYYGSGSYYTYLWRTPGGVEPTPHSPTFHEESPFNGGSVEMTKKENQLTNGFCGRLKTAHPIHFCAPVTGENHHGQKLFRNGSRRYRYPTAEPQRSQRPNQADPNTSGVGHSNAGDLNLTGIIEGSENVSMGTLFFKADHSMPAEYQATCLSNKDCPTVTTCTLGSAPTQKTLTTTGSPTHPFWKVEIRPGVRPDYCHIKSEPIYVRVQTRFDQIEAGSSLVYALASTGPT